MSDANSGEQDRPEMKFVGEEPVALAYDTANSDDDELIAKVYAREAAAELADAWWIRVEWLNEDERQ